MAAHTIDEFIVNAPDESQEKLQMIRTTIHEEAPEAVETISYGIPTFKLLGKNLIHFSGFKTHIGIYPTSSHLEAHIPEVAKYRTGKGTLQFPLTSPVPLDLIRKIVQIRVQEISASKK